MRRILYLDAQAGISGDMFVGALLDAGADFEILRRDVASLNLDGFQIRATRVIRKGLTGTKFDVLDNNTGKNVDEHHHHGEHHKKHHREHRHHHHHDEHHHSHHTHHKHHHHNHEHRSLSEIRKIIEGSSLAPEISADCMAVFLILGQAEAKIHGVTIEEVHFHEVGALDTIVDIVAAVSTLRQLQVDEVVCSPVQVGTGTVRCAHGVLPIPAPATLEILKGIPIYATDIHGELTTPTGAALLKHFCNRFEFLPPLIVETIGYGAGSREREIPNLLRAIVGKMQG